MYAHVRRLVTASRLVGSYGALVLRWLASSREVTNYTYHPTDQNRRELAHFISDVTGAELALVSSYLDEVVSDEALRQHVGQRTAASPHRSTADAEARYGRRIGWYALVRLLRPAVVVESGVDKGIGTCVLAAALLRNRDEGALGKVYAIDINPRAGWLVGPPYAEVVEFVFSDSHAALRGLEGPIDIFIHDSEHSYGHEAGEYAIVRQRLSEGALVVSDNAHATPTLMDFAEAQGQKYYFWHERPRKHFYPGGGIGIVASGASRADGASSP